MGAHFSRLRLVFSCVLQWVVGSRAGPGDDDSTTTRERLPDSDDIERDPCHCEGRANGARPKRRALLVGISYIHTGVWEVLEGTHVDVKRFRQLLIGAYSWLHLQASLGIDPFS